GGAIGFRRFVRRDAFRAAGRFAGPAFGLRAGISYRWRAASARLHRHPGAGKANPATRVAQRIRCLLRARVWHITAVNSRAEMKTWCDHEPAVAKSNAARQPRHNAHERLRSYNSW